MSFHKSIKNLLISFIVLSSVACHDNSEPVVKHNNIKLANKPLQTSTNVSEHPIPPDQQDNLSLLNKIHTLQEQLKSTEHQLSAIEKHYFSTTTSNSSIPVDDRFKVLSHENQQLSDNISKFRNDLQSLSMQYQATRQENELLKMEIATNQQIIHSLNSKTLHSSQ